jgi:exopolysaccharide production protein ExoZ
VTTTFPARTKPLISIQVARGLAALAVVAYHASLTQVKYYSGVNILPSIFSHGQSGVDLFFVISGFVMVLTTSTKHGNVRESGKFLWNRFFRIYPTYWVYFLVLVPVLLFLPGFVNSSEGGKVDLFTSFFLLPSSTLPLLLVAWTLTNELWFYVVFAVILLLPRRFLVPALALWFVILVAVNLTGIVPVSPALALVQSPLAIEFILGGVAALLFRRVGRVLAGVIAIGGVIVLIAAVQYTCLAGCAAPGYTRPLFIGIGFAMLLLATTAFETRAGIGPFARLKILGDMSYSIYLCHVLVLAALGRIWMALAVHIGSNAIIVALWWMITLVAVLTCGYLSYRFIERPVMKLAVRWRAKVFRESAKAAQSGQSDQAAKDSEWRTQEIEPGRAPR